MNECLNCGFWNSDYEMCILSSYELWYACPIESKKPENIKEMEEYMKWLEDKRRREPCNEDLEEN